ncbi:MAG: hypothetical protein DYG94_03315 [Leptolyngbya sp. PLA3]|nr:MAG: hypothetical protein EDM82_10985 [Cyanobacteria bacterium CYA]MCE7967760.1 hypothetical protein [Leptolyngbya sp. PL-A3]
MNRHWNVAGVSLSLTLVVCAGAQVSATFDFIPNAVSANDLTPNGRYVLGSLDSDGDFFPDDGYRWDRWTNTLTVIESQAIATGGDAAAALSDDGSIIVGQIPETSVEEFSNEAAMWTDAGGWVGLGWLPNAGVCPSRSDAYEVSADGSVVVGLSWDGCLGRGFCWTEATGMQELENLANGGNRASICSADGSVIAGFAQGNFNRTPAVWNGDTLEGTLLDPSGDAEGEWHGMSDDGQILLGTLYMGDGDGAFDAVKWTAAGGVEVIGAGSLIGGWGGNAFDIADNGTIVGFDFLLGNRRAWIQPNGTGPLVPLKDYITSHGGSVPTGLNLEVAQAISADGRVIIGHTAFQGAWIVTLDFGCNQADFAEPWGVLDFFDVQAYLNAFSGGNHLADLNGDSVLNFFDVQSFLATFANGCN